MPSMYNELDQIIADYVGFVVVEYEYYEGDRLPIYDCANPKQYDDITNEISRHLDRGTPFKSLSKDAQWCVTQWEILMKDKEEGVKCQ